MFTVGSPIGHIVGIGTQGENEGRPQWAYPMHDMIHYQSVSTANGVVYVIERLGNLNIVDAETGPAVDAPTHLARRRGQRGRPREPGRSDRA